jgi:hypothetical protein
MPVRVMGTVTATATALVKAKCMSTAKTMAMATTTGTVMATVTADDNYCHGKQQQWAGADDEGNRQERVDNVGKQLGRKVRQGWTC